MQPDAYSRRRPLRQMQRRREEIDRNRPVPLPERDPQVDDVTVDDRALREPVADAHLLHAARLAPLDAHAARAAGDAERPRTLGVARPEPPAADHDARS